MLLLVLLLFNVLILRVDCEVARNNNNNNATTVHEDVLSIVKCCEPFELLLDDSCTNVSETNETIAWKPEFADDSSVDGRTPTKNPPKYQLKIGSPRFVI